MRNFGLRRLGAQVAIFLNGEIAAVLYWSAAVELCRLIRSYCDAQKLAGFHPSGSPTEVLSSGYVVSVSHAADGKLLLLFATQKIGWEGPLDDMQTFANNLMGVARICEEEEQAEKIIRDQAIVIRAGAPFGLTSHPVIQKEALNMAQGDRDLRRFMPHGIKSETILGAPKFFLENRSPFQQALDSLNNPNHRQALVKELSKVH